MTNAVLEDPPVVLLVDDHPPNLLAVEAILDPLEYRVVKATSGEEALRRLAENHVVLILMDVHMPGLDGYQTTAIIRQHAPWRDIPIVFLTAVYNSHEHTRRGYKLGAVDYVTKPFDPEVLRGKVHALVTLYTRGQSDERAQGEEKERLKDLFLGAVGHDLRNPLNTILLASKLVLVAHEVKDARAHATRIARAAHRMQRMIEDILDLTRSELAGGISLARSQADLGEICNAMMDEQRLAQPDRVLTLDVSGDVRGEWDPDRLGRVVSNLIGNALEHQTGAVRAKVSEQGERVVLEVHNGGPPIDPEALRTLFEPFRRGTSGGSGLGLGLYIVNEIVRAHGGSVDVTSSSAEGTRFTVSLPKATVA